MKNLKEFEDILKQLNIRLAISLVINVMLLIILAVMVWPKNLHDHYTLMVDDEREYEICMKGALNLTSSNVMWIKREVEAGEVEFKVQRDWRNEKCQIMRWNAREQRWCEGE